MSANGTGESSQKPGSRPLTDSQFRWRAALPNDKGNGSGNELGTAKGHKEAQTTRRDSLQGIPGHYPSSVVAAYDARVRLGSRDEPHERRRTATSLQFDHSGQIVQPSTGHAFQQARCAIDEDGAGSEHPRASGRESLVPKRVGAPPVPIQPRPTSHPRPQPTTTHVQTRVHPQPPPLVPQIASASLDLQPAPPSTIPSSVHPVIIQNSAAALAPIRSLYEQAWYQTVSNVQTEMSRMHHELVDALERERAARARLSEENQRLKSDIDRVLAELRGTRREVEKSKERCRDVEMENENLRMAVATPNSSEPSGDRDEQVRDAARSYIDGQLEQMKVQYRQQLDIQRAEATRALEEQKAVFERERRELHIIASSNEAHRSSIGSESTSSSTLVASDTEKGTTPVYGHAPQTPSTPIHHLDRPRTQRMSVSSDTRSSPSTKSSPQLFYHPLSPLPYTTIPPKAPFVVPHGYPVRRQYTTNENDDSMDVDLPLSGITNPSHPLSPPPNGPVLSNSYTASSTPVDGPDPPPLLPPLLPQNDATRSRSARSTPITSHHSRSRRASVSSSHYEEQAPQVVSRSASRASSRVVSPTGDNPGRPALSLDIPADPPLTPLGIQQPDASPEHSDIHTLPHAPSPSKKRLSAPASYTTSPPVDHHPAPSTSTSRGSRPSSTHPPKDRDMQRPRSNPPLGKPVPSPPLRQQQQRQVTPLSAPPLSHPQLMQEQQAKPVMPLPAKPTKYSNSTPLPPHPKPVPSQVQPYQGFGYTLTPAPQTAPPLFSSFTLHGKRDRLEYEEASGSGERDRANVRMKLEDEDEGTRREVEKRKEKKMNKIGINHMDLLYETRGDKMICRMCRTPGKDEQKTPTATFPTSAKWVELVGHCQEVHPKACADLEKLSPSQVGELKQRMSSGKLTGYTMK